MDGQAGDKLVVSIVVNFGLTCSLDLPKVKVTSRSAILSSCFCSPLCLLPPTAKPRIKMNESQAMDAPLRVTVKAGQEVTLDCEAQGSPPPLVTWTKDTHPLLSVTNRYPALACGGRKGPSLVWRETGLKVVVTQAGACDLKDTQGSLRASATTARDLAHILHIPHSELQA